MVLLKINADSGKVYDKETATKRYKFQNRHATPKRNTPYNNYLYVHVFLVRPISAV